jgi:hypothetical protein
MDVLRNDSVFRSVEVHAAVCGTINVVSQAFLRFLLLWFCSSMLEGMMIRCSDDTPTATAIAI